MINFSEACERNKAPILSELKTAFAECKNIIEIGSGSGQHALFFAEQLPHLSWQPTDLAPYFTGLAHNLTTRPSNVNTPKPLTLDSDVWLENQSFDGLFSANTLHIMSWPQVLAFFHRSGLSIQAGGVLCIYGPFNYNGGYSSESNANFDLWLKQRDESSGIRDFEAVVSQANLNGFELQSDTKMPANNQFLRFIKT